MVLYTNYPHDEIEAAFSRERLELLYELLEEFHRSI